MSNTAIKNLCHYNEQCVKINTNNTTEDADDANTIIPIAPMYDGNYSNGNGCNWNVLDLTGNTKVIEENQIGQNKRKNYFCTLTDIMVWMVDNIPEKLVDCEDLDRKNTREMGRLNKKKRKQRKFLSIYINMVSMYH